MQQRSRATDTKSVNVQVRLHSPAAARTSGVECAVRRHQKGEDNQVVARQHRNCAGQIDAVKAAPRPIRGAPARAAVELPICPYK